MANVTVNSTTANVVVTDVDTQQQINVSSTTSTIVVSQVGSAGPPGPGNVVSVNGQTGSVVVLDTDDIAEGNTNLYYTDARANNAIADYDGNINTSGTITASAFAGDGSGLTNVGNVDSVNGETGVVVLDTDNVAEGNTNLYYTDARSNSAIDARVDKTFVDNLGVDYDSLSNTPTLASVATSGDYDDLSNTPTLASVATSGDYDDLINTPTLATVATSGDYDDLINTPTNVSEFTNDAGYLVNANLSSTTANVDSVNGETGVVVLDTDDIAEGNTNLYYTDTRSNSAIDARVDKAFVDNLGVDYDSLSNTPTLAAVATSGDYDDLINTPTNVSEFTNDAGYLVAANLSSTTANVDSVNGETGVVVLDTDDIAEGNTNLYYTDARSNSAIDARVDKAFVDNLGVDYTSLSNTPTNVSEFTNDAAYLVAANLSSTTANVDSVNGATGVVVLDTDDVAEGSNLYFTTARANTAIADYDGDIDTSGNISASNYFGPGGLGSRLTLTGDQITHGALLGAANTYTVGNQGTVSGYAVLDTTNSPFGAAIPGIDLVANVSLDKPIVTLFANLTIIGNVVTVNGLEEVGALGGTSSILGSTPLPAPGNLATLMSSITPGMTLNGRSSFPQGIPQPTVVFQDQFMYITEVNVAANTFVLSSPPEKLSNVGNLGQLIIPAGRDARTGALILFNSQYDLSANVDPGTSKFIIGKRQFQDGNVSSVGWRGTDIYAYPEIGPVTSDFEFSGGLTTDDLTLDMTNTAKKGRYVQSANNITTNFPNGITVGANALSSVAGIGDIGINPGINMLWDGSRNLPAEYGQTLNAETYQTIPTLSVYAFSDGTAADVLSVNFNQSTAASTGPRITLGAARGNISQAAADNYCRENQELGQLAFTGATPLSRAGVVKSPAAGIKVIAANDWDQANSAGTFSATEAARTAGNSDMYIYATSDLKRGRDLFISYKQGELNIGSGALSGTRKPIKFSPVGTMPSVAANPDLYHLLNDPRGAYTSSNRNWMEITSANISADTGTQVSITNGGTLGVGVVGDMVHKIIRSDNTIPDFESPATFMTTGLLGFLYGFTGLPGDAVGFGLPLASPALGNAQSISFANITGQGANLNGNTYYVKPGPVPFSTSLGYTLYTDDALTTVLTWTALSGSAFEGGNFGTRLFNAGTADTGRAVYDVISGVTGRDYTFTLAEQSEDLVISTNGNTHTTFTSDGDITTVGDITANAFVGDGSGLTNVGNVDSVNGLTGVVVLDTDDVAEGSNLYFSNARVITAVETANIKLKQFAETTGNIGVVSGDISGNIDVASATIWRVQANGNITLNSLANVSTGTSATIILDHQSNNNILSSTWKFAGNVRTISTTSGTTDIISVFYDGSDYYASLTVGYA